MVIGLLLLDLHFPQARSLKDKRMVLRRFRDRVRAHHNVAVSELEFQDLWQRARLGVVTLNSQAGVVADVLERILADAHVSLEETVVAGHEFRYY